MITPTPDSLPQYFWHFAPPSVVGVISSSSSSSYYVKQYIRPLFATSAEYIKKDKKKHTQYEASESK